jgi:2-C-methyl-D-erythritol 4-phosphate cytidylyltransferase
MTIMGQGHQVPRCFALVPCAGSGTRAGMAGPKQYAMVAGRPMVAWTLEALGEVARLEGVLVVVSPDDDAFERHVPGFAGERRWVEHCGGATRAESVARGIDALTAKGVRDEDWVLVHDAARCLVRAEWVDRLIDACIDDEVGGILALPVGDTLKQERDGRIATTVDRAGKWAAQTPQMFRVGVLRRALETAGAGVTDESSAVEAAGFAPRLVAGDPANMKLTWPGDFALAERLLAVRAKAQDMAPTERKARAA